MKSTGRLGFVHATMAFFMLAILGKAVQVQIVDHSRHEAAAAKTQQTTTAVVAPRGDILDATGKPLAQNRAMVRLEIKPAELRFPDSVVANLRAVGVEERVLARVRDTSVQWVVVPGTFAEADVAVALRDRVHPTRLATRMYALHGSTKGIVGRVDAQNRAVSGIELAMDAALKGTDGSDALIKDGLRRRITSPLVGGVESVKGQTVQLTINLALQAIVENALDTAVAKLGAEGGDIVILNPHNGEVLALASHWAGGAANTPSALTDPFEPGSTMKPFIAAALIERGLATETDSVDTGPEGVKYEINGRLIKDDHWVGRASLSDVIRESSNIGIVKFAERLTPQHQFEALRDFGFGMPTGITFPSEAPGRLREPAKWSRQSAQSLAMGYEMDATPLQLAAAYATFANGGELIEPWLVKEIRAPDGEVVFRHERRVVRRVISAATADRMRRMLLDVVDSGTAVQANVSTYMMAGKTGTPRATVNGRYVDGRYNPNFAGLFPGDAPQYVIVVKLTTSQKSYYAGQTAAPLTRAVLEAAIAAKDAALDPARLASSAQVAAESDHARQVAVQQAAPVEVEDGAPASVAPAPGPTPAPPQVPAGSAKPVVVRLDRPYVPDRPSTAPRPVPNVAGLTYRAAVRSLHEAGFRVNPVPSRSMGTAPSAGALASPGSLITLLHPY